MLLTIATTHRPATDLASWLGKDPARTETVALGWGAAHVFFPEAREGRCEAALLLEVDPSRLPSSRGERKAARPGGPSRLLHDRAYAASALLAVAIARVFEDASSATSPGAPIPLSAHLPVLRCLDEAALGALFAPLGYRIEARRLALDPRRPELGPSPYLEVTLASEQPVRDLLRRLAVLVPALAEPDDVALEALRRLLPLADGWIDAHPERDRIASALHPRRHDPTRDAIARLRRESGPEPDRVDDAMDAEEAALERPLELAARRRAAVLFALVELGAARVLVLGCGDGELVAALLGERAITRVRACDASLRALELARTRVEALPPAERGRVELFQGSALYRDTRFEGQDAICLLERVEHVEPSRLPDLARVVFEQARPAAVIVTTPNREQNPRLGVAEGALRHRDHRFEWTRAELARWAADVAARYGYVARAAPIGDDDPALGAPGQMAIFTRATSA